MNGTKKIEFSKVLAIVVTVLFTGVVLFLLAIWALTDKTPEQLQAGIDILGVVAAPFGIVVTGYFAKAGIENFQKIKNQKEDDQV